MKKKLIIGLFISASLLFVGCGNKKVEDKEKVTISYGEIAGGVTVGKKLNSYTLQDQFEKQHSLNDKVKKVIFVFTKATGHLMRVYLVDKDVNYLSSRNIDFIADISGMPSLIAKMFAIPDFKESVYPILLIRKKENAVSFRNEEQKNAIMIISLDNQKIVNVKFVTNEIDLKNEID